MAIDSTVSGRARGGLRLLPDVGRHELELAARAMTLKYGFLGLPQGGAKAGVFGDPTAAASQRRERLHAFGEAAAHLLHDGRYLPDADMGTDATDIRWMMESAGHRVGPRDWRSNLSGLHTARSTFAAAKAALAHVDLPLGGSRAAVEGFGHVGSALAQLLADAGARVVAVSTAAGAIYNARGFDVRQLRRMTAEGMPVTTAAGDVLPREALLELPLDLLCPCARGGSIHTGNVGRVDARVVCAGANNPVTADAERALWARGVVIPPDFINNSGGVLGGTLEYAGVSSERAGRLIAGVIEPAVRRLLDDAKVAGMMPRELAEPLALARHARVRHAADRPGIGGRLVHWALDCYRRGWLPGPLVGAIAPAYLERKLQA